jgi:integrase
MPDSSPPTDQNDPHAPSERPESRRQAPPPAVERASGGAGPLPARLAPLAETARDYARAAASPNTNRAYAADWRHYCAWARRQALPALPPDPQGLGLYIAACASGAAGPKPGSVSTIERRLSALMWNFAQRGETFDRKDRHVATVLAGIRRTQGRPPEQKEAILPEDLIAMIATLSLSDLRGLRDRAILLVGFAGGLRRSEIVGLDCRPEDGLSGGWIESFDDGLLLTLRGKTGWREVEIGRGSSDATCPVVALQTWLKFARISAGPLFRRVVGGKVGAGRLTDRHVARLIKRTALAAGVRGDLTEGERERKFSGHSLRAGLASSAEVDERYVQKQLGHASAEMTRRYQRRRDRFRVNLTKAAGL